MATALKLRSDIKKLKKAIETKGISAPIKQKLKSQLEKAENELAALKSTGKAPKKSSVAGTKTALTSLQKLVNRKKFSVYKGKGVDLKKDAGEGAMATGRRESKGLKANQYGSKASNKGNVYYEYRPNRLDVKQPKKSQKYPKLEDGGMMAMGGEITIIEDSYGKTAYVPYNGQRFVVEWTGDKPIKADVVISDKSFRVVDKDSSTFTTIHRQLLKAISDNNVKYMEKGGGIYTSDDRWVVIFQNEESGELEKVTVRANNKNSAIEIAEDEGGLGDDWKFHSVKKEMAEGGDVKSKFGYVAMYKGKRVELYADSKYQAQLKAAQMLGAKKSYDVSVYLAEVDGKPYVNTLMADGGYVVINKGGDRYDGGIFYQIKKGDEVVKQGLIDGEQMVEFEGKKYDGLKSLAEGIDAELKVEEMKYGGQMAEGGEIKKGDYVIVDNPVWKAALGNDKPVRRKVKMIIDTDVVFHDGSISQLKYVKKMEDGGVISNTHKID